MKYTIKDLQHDFPDDAACLKWLVEYLYPDGIYCKLCQKVTPHHAMKTRKSYSCELCGHHVHPTAGTIFHKSSTPLTLWFYAVYLMSSTRAGISAKQLERELGVTYKTAWRMFHQIRKMMGDDEKINLSGEVEVDETYIHADPSKNSRLKPKVAGKKYYDSQIVFGMVQRGGKAKVRHVKSSGARVLLPEMQRSIGRGALIHTDEWGAYRKLSRLGYSHTTVNHKHLEYVRGTAYTNTIEGFWSQLKRSIDGTYHSVSPKYLQNYLNEFSYRYNRRTTLVFPDLIAAAVQRVV